jgi:hypothetical protein
LRFEFFNPPFQGFLASFAATANFLIAFPMHRLSPPFRAHIEELLYRAAYALQQGLREDR